MLPSIASTEDTRVSSEQCRRKQASNSQSSGSNRSSINLPVRYLIVYLVAMCSIATVSVYAISLALGLLQYPSLYISSAMQYDPMRAVSCFFYPLMMVGMSLVFIAHSQVVRERLRSYVESVDTSDSQVYLRKKLPRSFFNKQNLVRSHNAGDVFITICMLCFLATIAISLQTSVIGHKVVAFSLFLAGTLAMSIYAFVDMILGLSGVAKSVFKLAVAISALISVCIMIVMSNVSYLGGSICELFAVAMLVVYLGTYWNDDIGKSVLRIHTVCIDASSEPDRDSTLNNFPRCTVNDPVSDSDPSYSGRYAQAV